MNPHVAIIGAGIIGAALADQLAVAGAEVTIIDAGRPGKGTSHTSLGWLNANNKQPRSYFDLSVEAMQRWDALARALGQPAWYRPAGNLTWAATGPAQEELAARVTRLRDWGYELEMITRERAALLEPAVQVRDGALIAHFPREGHVDGHAATDTFVDRACDRGAKLLTNDAVAAIETSSGRATGVRLESGARVAADVLVIAAGWRSAALAASVGADLRLVDIEAPGSRAQCLVCQTTPAGVQPAGLIHAPDLNIRPLGAAALQLEASDINATIDAESSEADLDAAAEELVGRLPSVMPAADGVQVRAARRCIRPMPNDGLPIVGRLDVDGLYVVVTHSGITLAPLLGQLAAKDILEAPLPALDAYRPNGR